jgi:predicted phosphodiesterase
MIFKSGIISDTHGLRRPEAKRRLAGVDHIINGGDIGHPEIIDALRRSSGRLVFKDRFGGVKYCSAVPLIVPLAHA